MHEALANAGRAADVQERQLELTILMPCLDEAETIGACIAKASEFLARTGIAGEILVADNGSTDGSPEIAAGLGARVVPVALRGYGSALAGGIAAARGAHIVMGDADGSYDFAALDQFVAQLRAGADLVMGNRFAGGIKPNAMPFLHRFLGNPVLSWLGRLLYGAPVGDFHCGLRGFRADAIRPLGLNSPGMEFASEMVVKATVAGLRIAEVPTTLSPDGRSRAPHLRTWRDGWRHLRFLLLLCPRWLFFYPGVALLGLGFAAMIWLLPGPRRIGGVVLDVNTLVYCAVATITGAQAIAFSLLARSLAARDGLLPARSTLVGMARLWTLEAGLVAGAVLTLAGIAASVWAVEIWQHAGFGELDPSQSLRVVVPAATAIALGLQGMFASFLLAMVAPGPGARKDGRGGPAE